jgi:transcriptional regulator with XRE-family HTH domain
MRETLAIALRNARVKAGLSLRGAEKQVGISNAYLSQLENGKADNPSVGLLQKLAIAYGVPTDVLLVAAGYAPGKAQRDIFLSHRSTDKAFVRDLAAEIEAQTWNGRPLSVWLDEAEIRPGSSIPASINEGLEKSRFIGIVMTPDYFESPSHWTDAEWHAALHGDPDNQTGKLIPLLVKDCPVVPYLLRHLKAIDLRGNRYQRGFRDLLTALREEPLRRPLTHRGQLITSGSRIDRSTLVAERAIPEADPDVVTERLYCNLLPAERFPRWVYMAPIASDLVTMSSDQKKTKLPSKERLKQIIRDEQEKEGIDSAQRFMPAFRTFEERVVTFHNLEDPNCPLNSVIEDNEIEILDISSFLRDEDLKKIVISLLNMALSRHLYAGGLETDQTKYGRYFFPDRNGQPNQISWTPRRKRAVRTVAKPITSEGKVLFWRNLGAYLQIIFLVNKFYVKISPTWVITQDGHTPSTGPEIGRRVIRWTGPERNLQILYHIRFWTSVLRRGYGGPISIRAGDQTLELSTIPAVIQLPYGISDDQRDLMRLLDEEAPLMAAEEDEEVDSVLESELEHSALEEDLSLPEDMDAVPGNQNDEVE